jgi:hypothetical protein
MSRGVGVKTLWEPSCERLKSGKPSKRLVFVWYTELQTCQLCGFMSTPKKVWQRDDVRYWDTETDREHSKVDLCTGCWNKVKPLAKAKEEARKIKYLTNKLYKEGLKWRKLQTPES